MVTILPFKWQKCKIYCIFNSKNVVFVLVYEKCYKIPGHICKGRLGVDKIYYDPSAVTGCMPGKSVTNGHSVREKQPAEILKSQCSLSRAVCWARKFRNDSSYLLTIF